MVLASLMVPPISASRPRPCSKFVDERWNKHSNEGPVHIDMPNAILDVTYGASDIELACQF